MSEPQGRLAAATAGLDGLDPLLQHPMRLGICVLLAKVDRMKFARLKGLLDATDGNLGAQLLKLEEARYVAVRKAFEGRRPASWYSLQSRGQDALDRHLAAMGAIVSASRRR